MARPDLSLVVAIRNQRPHNELFLESLAAHSRIPAELIVIDNSSADGSAELYRQHGAEVISTGGNVCYPESMNLGLQRAAGQFVGFVNNDIYFGAGWDEAVLDAMERHDLDVACPSGMEKMLTSQLSAGIYARWDLVKRSGGVVRDVDDLRRLIRTMYGDWGQFCRQIRELFRGRLLTGIVGNCVVVRRSCMDALGGWDSRVQAGDWDLYLAVRDKIEQTGRGQPPMVVCQAYVHHFIRATVKSEGLRFTCTHPRLSVEEKWGRPALQRLWSDPEEVRDRPRLCRAPVAFLRRRVLRTLAKGRKAVALARSRLFDLPGPEELTAFLCAEAAAVASTERSTDRARGQ